MATEEQIKDLAHAIWEQESYPEGKHLEHYFRAKQILEEQEVADVIVLGPPRPTIQLAALPPTIESALPRKRRSFTRHKRR